MMSSTQKLSWSWFARIWWSVMWRWIAAYTVAVIVGGTVDWSIERTFGFVPYASSVTGFILLALWFILLGWALGSALRARRGGYRLVLVSADGATAPG